MVLRLYSKIFEVFRKVLLLDYDPVLSGNKMFNLGKDWLIFTILET